MMPLTETAAAAAPDEAQKASSVSSGTVAACQGATSSATMHAHMTAVPTTNQRLRVRLESTIGAHTNSNVNASEVTARIVPTRCTGTPALTRLLVRASPMT